MLPRPASSQEKPTRGYLRLFILRAIDDHVAYVYIIFIFHVMYKYTCVCVCVCFCKIHDGLIVWSDTWLFFVVAIWGVCCLFPTSNT